MSISAAGTANTIAYDEDGNQVCRQRCLIDIGLPTERYVYRNVIVQRAPAEDDYQPNLYQPNLSNK